MAQNALLKWQDYIPGGYVNHSQLQRFKAALDPSGSMFQYLACVYAEGRRRGLNFNPTLVRVRIANDLQSVRIPVTQGQVYFEIGHYNRKLAYTGLVPISAVKHGKSVNTVFYVVPGERESWEKTKE